jgi:RsiW-degrading membrane proteinase PrsW (M82 family)
MVGSTNDGIVIYPRKLGWREKLFFLISGIVVSIPVTLFFGALSESFYSFLPLIYSQVLSVIILTPFIEEFAKAYPLFYRYSLSERSLFILGLLVGLGFGITEFFVYVFGYGAPVYARLFGLFFHAASTSLVAYGIAKNRPIMFYLIAVFLHFSYNLSALREGAIGVIIISIFVYILAGLAYLRTTEKSLEPK